MNCKTVEGIIFLYAESSEEERQIADKHIDECSACHALHLSLIEKRSMLNEAFQDITLEYPQAFTNAVMSGVNPPQRERTAAIAQFIFHSWVRNALAAMSVMLIVFFSSEWIYQPDNMAISNNVLTGDKVVLNSSDFLRNIVSSGSSDASSSLMACVRACIGDRTRPECQNCLGDINTKKSL